MVSMKHVGMNVAADPMFTWAYMGVNGGNVIITAPVEAMDVSLRSISGRVRTEGVNIREGEGVPSVRVTGVTADLKLISIKD